MSWRNALITLALVAAIAASWTLLQRRRVPPPVPTAVTESGYYLTEAIVEGMDDNGRRLYTLRAARILEKPDTSAVRLEQVDLEYSFEDGPPWRLEAADGEIPADGSAIALRGGVTMAEKLMRGEVPATVRTPSLDIDLLSHRATTANTVEIQRGNYRMTATGMVADLKGQTLTLQSDVHGTFLP